MASAVAMIVGGMPLRFLVVTFLFSKLGKMLTLNKKGRSTISQLNN